MPNYISIAVLSIGLLLALSCKSPAAVSQTDHPTGGEPMLARVFDYSGLSGCGKVLRTEQLKVILPSNPDKLESLRVGRWVEIAVRPIEDAMSNCMAEDYIAEIISLTELPSIEHVESCPPVYKLEPGSWMQGIINTYGITHIDRHAIAEGYLYSFHEPGGGYQIYDCVGYEVCQIREKVDADCQELIAAMVYEDTIFNTAATH